MSLLSRLWLAGGITLLVWIGFTWPLPPHVLEAVPASAHVAPASLEPMSPGDHLQFMYYCRLAGDMVTGQTPLFYNLYEFNTGDDRHCFQPEPYYIPFSLIFSAGAALGGDAAGWNLTGFISLWLTYWLTWVLVGRHVKREWIAGSAALISIVLPFRWINLCGGSPAGFAMMWVPLIWLGIDVAVRDKRIGGGLMAGLGILFAGWTDQHVWFFSVLALPAWFLIALLADDTFRWNRKECYVSLVKALWPVPVFLGGSLAFPLLMKALNRWVIGETPKPLVAGARTLKEVLNYSPEKKGVFGLSALSISEQIYVGYAMVGLLVLGGVAHLVKGGQTWRIYGRKWAVFAVVLGGVGLILLLALGMRGPWDGAWIKWFRQVVPPYAMIRQPAKIFCLLPIALAMALALALMAVARLRESRLSLVIFPLMVVGAITVEYGARVHPTVTRLESHQGAYAAVADRAMSEQTMPRALVIPLWPGDTHYSSLYQHFASLYRIRMVNGYNPFIRSDYFEKVFRPFESINQGVLDHEQVEILTRMGVQYLLLHENEFPEKVSPYPVSHTLKALLNHPRLELLKQDGSVWAFRILSVPVQRPAVAAHWTPDFPARRWELEKVKTEGSVARFKDKAGGGAYVRLEGSQAAVWIPVVKSAYADNLRWMIRIKGYGVVQAVPLIDGQSAPDRRVTVKSEMWQWIEVPTPFFARFLPVSLKLSCVSGSVDADVALLTAGVWQALAKGEQLVWPAPLFFHAGFSDVACDRVVFRQTHEAGRIVFYGPKLPLEPGVYEVDVRYDTTAAPGTQLGVVNLEHNDATGQGVTVPLIAGQPAIGQVRRLDNLPFNIAFVYCVAGDLRINSVAIRRME